MGVPKLLNEATIEHALRKSYGILTHAAKELGVTRAAVDYHVRSSPKLKAVVAESREIIVDHAEHNVMDAVVTKGDEGLSKWVLERLGKKRGYGNSTEHGISEDDIYAIVASFGGDLEKLKAFRAALDAPPMIEARPVSTEPAGE